MRTVLTVLILISLTACAGLAPINTHHNEQFKVGDDSEAAPAFKVTFGPDESALKGMAPADVKEVLLAYAEAAGRWLTFNFQPKWEQRIQTEIEGTATQEQTPTVETDIEGIPGTP